MDNLAPRYYTAGVASKISGVSRARLERMAERQGYPQLALNQLLPDGQLAPLFPVEVVHRLAEAVGTAADATIKAVEQEAEHGQS